MSTLTKIDDIPLFSTTEEAIAWGVQYGLSGYHTHVYENQTGYMAGRSHTEALFSFTNGVKQTTQSSTTVYGRY